MAWLLLLLLRVLVLAARDDGEKAQTAQEGAWLLTERRRAAATEGNLILFGRIINTIDVFRLGARADYGSVRYAAGMVPCMSASACHVLVELPRNLQIRTYMCHSGQAEEPLHRHCDSHEFAKFAISSGPISRKEQLNARSTIGKPLPQT